jgi:arsenate reductase
MRTHWGMPDPAAVEGDEATKRAAFRDALAVISRRIDRLIGSVIGFAQ